jgi:hypothetical protein
MEAVNALLLIAQKAGRNKNDTRSKQEDDPHHRWQMSVIVLHPCLAPDLERLKRIHHPASRRHVCVRVTPIHDVPHRPYQRCSLEVCRVCVHRRPLHGIHGLHIE